jgi:8-oxo-dGTP pyrophosphatase MutT (NUDIX family)
MKFDNVIQKLGNSLNTVLPGRIGQEMMSPLPIDERRFTRNDSGKFRKSAVLILFYPVNGECWIPFIKRPKYLGVHSGQISLPGGKWEPDDLSLKATALREAEEEIGIDASQVEILGSLSDLYVPPSNFMISPYVGYTFDQPHFNPDPLEVEKIITCSFDTLIDGKNQKSRELKTETGLTLTSPYFDIDREIVWGATAMILGELMYLWKNS